MNAKEKATRLKQLEKQIAELEVQLGELREEHARLLRPYGDTTPLSGLDMLWQAALPKGRERSSRLQCRKEWAKIPLQERPKIEAAVDALKAWNKSEQWSKNGGEFAPGLHIFIKNRKWEDLPPVRDPIAKYRSTPKPVAAPAPGPESEEYASPEEIAEILGSIGKLASKVSETSTDT